MRRLFLIGLLIGLLASAAWGETFLFPIEKNPKETAKIEVAKEKLFILVTVTTKEGKVLKYRVYPCGQVEMEQWKELAPNVDRTTGNALQLYHGSTAYTLENRNLLWNSRDLETYSDKAVTVPGTMR